MHVRPSTIAAPILCALALAASAAHAQTQWLDRDAGTSVRFDALASRLPYWTGRFPTGVVVATARLAITPRAWAVVEIPHAMIRQDYLYYGGGGGGTLKQDAFGNPYVGLEFARRVTGLHYELGVRLPRVNHDRWMAVQTGFASGVEREQAFLRDATSFRLAADYHHAASAERPIGYDVRMGPLVQLNTGPLHGGGDTPGDAFGPGAYETLGLRSEVFLDYDANVRLGARWVSLGVGLTGRWIVTRSASTFADHTIHELSFVIGSARGVVRPSLRLDQPLDKLQRELHGRAAGVALTFVP